MSVHLIIIFSALCLESLINDYCVIRRSGNYLKKYLDKLDTPSKWFLIPKLLTGKEIPSDSQALELIKGLYSIRNRLVHPKSKELGKSEIISDNSILILRHVPKSLKAIKEATNELYKIDPEFNYLDDYKFLWDKNTQYHDETEIERIYKTIFGRRERN